MAKGVEAAWITLHCTPLYTVYNCNVYLPEVFMAIQHFHS